MSRLVVMIFTVVVIAVIGVWLRRKDHAAPTAVQLSEVPAGVPELPADLAAATGPIIAWSAQTQARFEPCGCTAGMYGGLVRRGGLLARLSGERVLSLELGGWSAGSSAHHVVKSSFYLRGLRKAGIDAIAVGSTEITLGATSLTHLASEAASHGLPLVSANVQGVVGILPSVRLSVAGKDLLLTSVAPRSATGEGLSVSDPVDSLAPIIAAAGSAEVVVMADLSEAALADLARAQPRLSVVVGGAVDGPSPQPSIIGAVRVIHVANHGKTIGWWAWGSATCRFDLIPDALPDVPALRAVVGEYQRTLAATDLAIDHTKRGGGMVGDAACTACHTQAATVHAASRHAYAFASLEKKGYQADPDCLRCHVTALGKDGGFRRPDPRDWRASVSCESCHGPGQAHVQAGGKASPLRPVGAATCVQCHDAENSPQFQFATYWEKIRHGK